MCIRDRTSIAAVIDNSPLIFISGAISLLPLGSAPAYITATNIAVPREPFANIPNILFLSLIHISFGVIAAFFNVGNMSWSRSLLKVHITEFVELVGFESSRPWKGNSADSADVKYDERNQ